MIRSLKKDEIQQAYLLVKEIVENEKDAHLNENAKKSILSYLKEHLNEFSYIGSFDSNMNGMLIYEEDTFQIIMLLVKEEYRHQDVGSSLLDALKQQAKIMNISKIRVRAMGFLQNFYRSRGFEDCEESDTNDDLSVVFMEYYLGRESIGKIVTVVIERQYGSYHPTLEDVVLPYNFGYVKQDITMDDFQFQDAYVIGIQQPLDEFTGEVIGIIYHKEDEKSRWIVAPRGMVADHDAVIQLLGNEEQYFDTKIIWSKS